MEEKAFVHRKAVVLGVVCAGIAGLLGGFLAGYGVNGGYGVNRESTHSNTSVETVTDNIPVRKPVAKDSTVISYIKVPIAGMKGGTQNGSTKDTKDTKDGAQNGSTKDTKDSASALKGGAQNHIDDARDTAIYLPRTQKRYGDSTYTAWVSGYEPRLDSIEVYRKTTTITKTITRTVTRNAGKRHVFNVGIVGGAGYGIMTKKPDVWIGIGGSIKLFGR